MKKLVFIIMSAISLSLMADDKPKVMGGYFNSGYEKMTCQQMISSNLKLQAASLTTENSQK
jgi:hypothetical protein